MSNNEKNIVESLFRQHLRSIGVVSLGHTIKGKKRLYLFTSIVVCTMLVWFCEYSLWIFIVPLIPLFIYWLMYIIDLAVMIKSVMLIQRLMVYDYEIIIETDKLLEYLEDYVAKNNLYEVM